MPVGRGGFFGGRGRAFPNEDEPLPWVVIFFQKIIFPLRFKGRLSIEGKRVPTIGNKLDQFLTTAIARGSQRNSRGRAFPNGNYRLEKRCCRPEVFRTCFLYPPKRSEAAMIDGRMMGQAGTSLPSECMKLTNEQPSFSSPFVSFIHSLGKIFIIILPSIILRK